MNSTYTVTYRGSDRSGDSTIQYESEFSVREVIQSTLSSISSLQSNNSAPTAILVGTHLDKCNEEDVSVLEKSVQDSFDNFINSDVLCQANNKPPARYIHPVNNVSGDSSDIMRLRELITTTVHSKRFKPEPVPTATLLLHLILRKKFNPTPGWCSLEECVEIAERCGISREDLTKEGGILQYLHDSFGTILYYQGKTRQGKKLKISQRVIVNPNVILHPPVELVVTAFGAEGIKQALAKKIRFTGEIDHSQMKRACENNRPSDDKIPTDEIVELLKSRYILHEDARSAKGEPVYFLPCLLSSDNNVFPQSRDHSHLNDLTYAPLLLIPNEEHIPPGLFSATIVKLSQHWKLFETKVQNDAKQTRFRNRIHFIFKGALDVELRALSTHLECRILHDATEPCPIDSRISECRSELIKYFEDVLSSFPHTREWKWDFGFYCPHALRSDKIPPHPACCTDKVKPQKVECCQYGCKEGLVGLDQKHMCWFTVSLNTPTCIVAVLLFMFQSVTDLL